MALFQIVLKDSLDTMEKNVLDAYRLHLNSVFKRAAGSIQKRVGDVCESMIARTEEYESLLGNQLLAELGVPEIEERLNSILRTIKESVIVDAVPIIRQGRQLLGGLIVKMIKSDFEDILSLADASYRTEKDVNIPWLDWLLLQGDTIIVLGYDVRFVGPSEAYRSRTGMAIMTPGSGWRVPPEYSGTAEDNFITRAFKPAVIENALFRIIEQEVTSRL